MQQYHDLLRRLITGGDIQYNERTQNSMIVSAGDQCTYDLRDGFPLLTSKFVPPMTIARELFWMLRGERNVSSLHNQGVRIWDANAFQHYLDRNSLSKTIRKHTPAWNDAFEEYTFKLETDPEFAAAEGDLGPVYGWQWRHWPKYGPVLDDSGAHKHKEGNPLYVQTGEVDQIDKIIRGLKEQPGSRYHILSAWNVGEIPEMAIGPCHCMAQFNVLGNERLDVNMFQRSCDVFLGVPFNMAQYALMTHLIAKEAGLNPGKFIHSLGNVHIYNGVRERAEFLQDPSKLKELRDRVSSAKNPEDYIDTRKWYEFSAKPEREEDEKKDHLPMILTQLSRPVRKLPTIRLADIPLEEIINSSPTETIFIEGYDPDKGWDARAVMAA